MNNDTYIPQGINPHQGVEWQLMQAGQKKLALFALHLETLPIEFASNQSFATLDLCINRDYKPSGKQRQTKRRRGAKQLIFKIFYQPDALQQAQKLEQILMQCYQADGKITAEAERQIGALLGYESEDITVYLTWVEQFQQSLYLPENLPTLQKK